MNLSTEIINWGTACQAALITFEPWRMAQQLFFSFLVLLMIMKVMASYLLAILQQPNKKNKLTLPKKLKKIATNLGIDSNIITLVHTQYLQAFTSMAPGIASGIYLSTQTYKQLTVSQLSAVLLHEYHHWQHKHPYKLLAFAIIAEVFFFIPIVRDVKNHWQLKTELAADAFASKKIGKSALQSALHTWLSTPTVTPSWSMAFAECQLDHRIAALSAQPLPRTISWNVIRRTITSLFILGLLTLVHIKTTQPLPVHAKLIIPTSTQCTSIWQDAQLQSSIFDAVSKAN